MNRLNQTRLVRAADAIALPLSSRLPASPMKEFLAACGAPGQLVLLVENRGLTTKSWSAPQPFALVGRDPTADVTLDHPRVDGLHAYIQVIHGQVHWVDLGSQTGTRRENDSVRSGWLSHPQGIDIGPYTIRPSAEFGDLNRSSPWESVLPDPLSSRPRDIDDLPQVILEFRRGSAKPIRWRMKHTLTLVGTSSHCKIRLSAPGVFPFHCSLLRTASGMWVVNLAGKEDVIVNGSSLQASLIDDGDELEIGDVLIRVYFQDAVGAKPATRSIAEGDPGGATLLAHPSIRPRGFATNLPRSAWPEHGPLAGVPRGGDGQSAGELSESQLSRIFDQFGELQRQFLSQFQQTTMVMVKALDAMHRDQMLELGEKIDSLGQFGEILQAIQAHMTAEVVTATHRDIPDPSQTPPSHPGFGAASVAGTLLDPQCTTAVPNSGIGPFMPAEDRDEQLRTKVRSLNEQSKLSNTNVHEWIIGRIAALEVEERSRWQKLLDLLRYR